MLLRQLSKDPTQRFPNARSFVDALEHAPGANTDDATQTRPGRRDTDDLTRVVDGRNVISFVSGDQSPHSTFDLRSSWICFAVVALRARA